MKKIIVTILMLACVLGLTACGGSENKMDAAKELNYQEIAGSCYLIISSIPKSDMAEFSAYTSHEWDTVMETLVYYYSVYTDGGTLLSGMDSWWRAKEEIGEVGTISTEESYASLRNDIQIAESRDGVIANVPVKGSKHDAVMEIIFDDDMNVTSITTNVSYSFGEKMAKAGLNTLMGMGTVFAVLILICLIISAFSLIPKIQNAFAKKPSGETVTKEAVDNTIAQISEREEEELADNLELVAVISAAIAASEGAAGTDGFVVRSIRRAGRR